MMPNDRTAPADSSQVIADLQRVRDEALARETAIAEVLGVINSSVGDLTPVFQVILEKAHSLCGATFGGLLTYDGNRFQAVALHGVPEAFAKIARQPFPPTPSNPVSRLLEGDPFVQVADLSEIVDAAPDDAMARAGVDLGGIRTLLMVALRKQGTLLGAVTAYRQEVRPFTDKQIALLSGVQLETNCAGLADHAAEREAIRLLAREVKSAFR
jgi:hypothetical protein